MPLSHYRRVSKPPTTQKRKLKEKRKSLYVPIAPLDLDVDDRISWAISTINREIIENDGVYPFSERRPGVQEVLRRANLSKSFLEKKGISRQRDLIQKNRKQIILSGLYLSPMLDRTVAATHNETAVQDELSIGFKQKWHETVLELGEALAEVERLSGLVNDLEKQLKGGPV